MVCLFCSSRGQDSDPGCESAVLLDDQLFSPKAVDDQRDGGDDEVTQKKLVEILLFLHDHSFTGFPGLELGATEPSSDFILVRMLSRIFA